jgi:drug/metabolite transporter (DMT)-like permease
LTQPPGHAPLTPAAFATLLGLASLFGANHIAARMALDAGLDVPTAVAARSGATALVVAALLAWQRVPRPQATPRQRWALGLIALLVAVQSAWIYMAVARIPVGLALVAFNTYPLCAALAVALLYRQAPPRHVLLGMPVILLGLGLALNVIGGDAAAGRSWAALSTGVGLALGPRSPLALCWRSPSTRWPRWTAAGAAPSPWAAWPCWPRWPWPPRAGRTGRTRPRAGWRWRRCARCTAPRSR